ncbi:MAG TPA: DUF1835 domain-containing protein [Gaiellaceae bacterium]
MKVGEVALARQGREPTAPPALLHVTNGESAGNTLRSTSLGGAVLPWNDTLHEGPVPAVSRRELLDVRAAFLSGCGWGSRREIRSSLERRDRLLTRALREGARVVLWFEHDLYDQLQLVDALALMDGALPELIVVSSYPGRPGFRGLGELRRDELETLWPGRRPATHETLAAARHAWDAFRAPDPAALAALAADGSGPLEQLGAALLRLLEELPSPRDGLSRTERGALEAIDAGARTPAAAFVAAQELEAAPFLGDAWFFRTMAGLGGGNVRLVEVDDGSPLPAPPPLGDSRTFSWLPVRVTETGRAVLRGEADRVDLLGLDRWLGGIHLTAENAWRWDPDDAALRPPA